MATIGWYGPLIDLSEASSHSGHFVQLVVFVHRTLPVQYKTSGGGKVIRTDIQVGDDTRPYFPVSIWQKHMEPMLKPGNIILLQNVKVTQFGDVVEARTVQQSSIQCLVDSDSYDTIHSKGANNLMNVNHIGIATEEKLKKVVAWVVRVAPIPNKHVLHRYKRNQNSANWKFHEETQNKDCLSLLDVSNLNDSCKASFFASIGEMFLPITSEFEEERMFIRSRIFSLAYKDLIQDLICTGCQLCGAPLNSEFGSRIEQETVPLYCKKSSNRLHVVSLIYRPFLLYVFDESAYIPVVVKNKAAEILVGNIKAESVYSTYQKQAGGQRANKSIQDQCGQDLSQRVHYPTGYKEEEIRDVDFDLSCCIYEISNLQTTKGVKKVREAEREEERKKRKNGVFGFGLSYSYGGTLAASSFVASSIHSFTDFSYQGAPQPSNATAVPIIAEVNQSHSHSRSQINLSNSYPISRFTCIRFGCCSLLLLPPFFVFNFLVWGNELELNCV